MGASMRVDIATAGGGVLQNELRSCAASGQVLAEVQERLTSRSALSSWDRYAALLERIAGAWKAIRQAQEGVKLETPAAAVSSEIRARAMRPVTREVKSGEEATDAGDGGDTTDSLSGRSQRKRQATDATNGAPTRQVRRAIGRGPRETLGLVDEELGQSDLSEPRREDLQRRRFLLRRQIVLDERRRANEPKSLNSPGLLELFQDMNGLLGKLKRGNLSGAAQQILDLTNREDIGGLNISQKIGRGLGFRPMGQVAAELGIEGAAGAGVGTGTLLAGAGVAAAVVGGLLLTGAALHSFTGEVQSQTARLRQMGAAQTITGGSLVGATSLGLDPGAAAGLAEQIRQRASIFNTDPFTRGAMSRAGISPMLPAEYGGPQNNAKLLDSVIERLRQLRPALGDVNAGEKQLLEARQLGATQLLDYVNVSDRVMLQQRRDAEVRQRLYDPAQTQAARDLAEEQRRLAQNWGELKGVLVTPAISGLAKDVGDLATAAREAGIFLRPLAAGLSHATTEIVKRAAERVPGIGPLVAGVNTVEKVNTALRHIPQVRQFEDAHGQLGKMLYNRARESALKADPETRAQRQREAEQNKKHEEVIRSQASLKESIDALAGSVDRFSLDGPGAQAALPAAWEGNVLQQSWEQRRQGERTLRDRRTY